MRTSRSEPSASRRGARAGEVLRREAARFAVERFAVARFALDFFAVARLADAFFADAGRVVDFLALDVFRLVVVLRAGDFFAGERRVLLVFFALDLRALLVVFFAAVLRRAMTSSSSLVRIDSRALRARVVGCPAVRREKRAALRRRGVSRRPPRNHLVSAAVRA